MMTPFTPRSPRLSPGTLGMALLLSFSFPVSPAAAQDKRTRDVDWVELIPEHDLEALLNPPEWIYDIDDGALDDDPDSLFAGEARSEEEARYRQALNSTDVVAQLDGQQVRIPGFVVPLSILAARLVDEFFLVPYMGACLHLPPPPPNQVIHVRLEKGLELTSLYQPYWIEGTLHTRTLSNDLAESAYALEAVSYEFYSED